MQPVCTGGLDKDVDNHADERERPAALLPDELPMHLTNDYIHPYRSAGGSLAQCRVRIYLPDDVRYLPEVLVRVFFSTRFTRKLDDLGYVTLQRFRLYGEEGLAGKDAALWLQEETLSVEYAGESLSSYEVRHDTAGSGASRLREVTTPTLFETFCALRQLRLFDLAEALGEEGWLKVLRLDDYAARR